jgi:hypothetical protein
MTSHRPVVRWSKRAARVRTAPSQADTCPTPHLGMSTPVLCPQYSTPVPARARAHSRPARRDRVALFIVSPPLLGFCAPIRDPASPPPPQVLLAMAVHVRAA